MDYDKIIDLDNVELWNCISLYVREGICTVIKDGGVVGFEREDMGKGRGCEI